MREIVTDLTPDELNWIPGSNDDTNSIAQMLSHAMEAERFLVSTTLDRTVDRNREAQFKLANVTSADLLSAIDQTEMLVNSLLDELTVEHLATGVTRPTSSGERTQPGAWWLFHAIEHSCEHLGQARLTRQLLDGRDG
jgi:uncharacterized damage-inducible protein DinB